MISFSFAIFSAKLANWLVESLINYLSSKLSKFCIQLFMINLESLNNNRKEISVYQFKQRVQYKTKLFQETEEFKFKPSNVLAELQNLKAVQIKLSILIHLRLFFLKANKQFNQNYVSSCFQSKCIELLKINLRIISCLEV